jgi:hypothetical protein
VEIGEDEPVPGRSKKIGMTCYDLEILHPHQSNGTSTVKTVIRGLEIDGDERPGEVSLP